MEAKNLRIGNFVKAKSPEKTEWVERHRISAHTLYSMEHPTAMDFVKPDMKPILITTDWLADLGFDNWDENKWERDGIVLLKYDEGCTYLSNQLHVNIFHIHELQNLFFALTRKELELKTERSTF